MAVRQDVLHVRSFNTRDGDRVIVDFDENPNTDRFMTFSSEGATIHVGVERIYLGWEALAQLAEVQSLARKRLKTRR